MNRDNKRSVFLVKPPEETKQINMCQNAISCEVMNKRIANFEGVKIYFPFQYVTGKYCKYKFTHHKTRLTLCTPNDISIYYIYFYIFKMKLIILQLNYYVINNTRNTLMNN